MILSFYRYIILALFGGKTGIVSNAIGEFQLREVQPRNPVSSKNRVSVHLTHLQSTIDINTDRDWHKIGVFVGLVEARNPTLVRVLLGFTIV
ncbi:MAG TPA: hypothetical protein V6D28_24310 [Leptolyngbyaceae cyanobacterium]